MNALATAQLATSALIIFALGGVHLVLTFRGPKLFPRDTALHARLKEVSPVISCLSAMHFWAGATGSAFPFAASRSRPHCMS